MLTFGDLGVLNFHLQLSEENVLCRVLAQVTKYLERGRDGEGRGGREERDEIWGRLLLSPQPEDAQRRGSVPYTTCQC